VSHTESFCTRRSINSVTDAAPRINPQTSAKTARGYRTAAVSLFYLPFSVSVL